MSAGWYARPSTRKQTLPRDWTTRRVRVLRRDGYRCQHVRYDTNRKCGEYANQVDHVDDRDDHALTNLQSLCEWHHNQKTASQGGSANAARRKQHRAPHPGITR